MPNLELAKRMCEQAKMYGKHDLERLGVFIEMPYMNGKGYVSPFPRPKRDKDRGMFCERYKSRCGTMSGYFDDEFRRLFTGEAISKPPKRKSEPKESEAKGKNIRPVFIPPSGPEWSSCPGDFFGTFGGKIEAMSRAQRKTPPHKPGKHNPMTNPGKKGGPGYPHICLSKYPEYISSPYRAKYKYKQYGAIRAGPMVTNTCPQPYFEKNPFFEEKKGRIYIAPKEKPHFIVGDGKWKPTGPAKWQGGCHAGLFDRFPEYISNRDLKKEAKAAKQNQKEKVDEPAKFLPQSMALKKMLTCSILQHNTSISVNATTYKIYEPVYIKRLIN